MVILEDIVYRLRLVLYRSQNCLYLHQLHKSVEKARVIFRLRRSDIVASDSDMKACGFRDILFAIKLA